MNETLIRAIGRLAESLGPDLQGDEPPEWLTALAEAAEVSHWPMATWSPGQEALAARALVECTNWLTEVLRPTRWDGLADLLPPELFLVSELMDVHEWDGGQFEFWRTRRLRFTGLGPLPHALGYVRLNAEAENHGNLGWHIHPMSKHGEHYGYKMLFDARRTQQDLSWELHSHRGKALPWGSPQFNVLSNATSQAIHRACEAAVLSQAILRHHTFKEWAARFQRPGATSYVAHPAPMTPTRW